MKDTLVPKETSHIHIGIILRSDGKWKEQIHSITIKAKRRLDILRFYMHRLDRKTIECLNIVYIRPILEYAGAVWDNCIQEEKDDLESIQREAARIALGVKRGTSHDFIYSETR